MSYKSVLEPRPQILNRNSFISPYQLQWFAKVVFYSLPGSFAALRPAVVNIGCHDDPCSWRCNNIECEEAPTDFQRGGVSLLAGEAENRSFKEI